jgi:hypothetical protein
MAVVGERAGDIRNESVHHAVHQGLGQLVGQRSGIGCGKKVRAEGRRGRVYICACVRQRHPIAFHSMGVRA